MTNTYTWPGQSWTIGFDSMFDRLEKLQSQQQSYPPHNIIKHGEDKFEIVFCLISSLVSPPIPPLAAEGLFTWIESNIYCAVVLLRDCFKNLTKLVNLEYGTDMSAEDYANY